jgi:hypothetical protein
MNIKNIEEQLNMLQKTVMNTEEKDTTRNIVVSYMRENPLPASFVRNSGVGRLQYQRLNNSINNKIITKTRMTIAIIIALLLGGGTSFAAENALPGDALYTIKINVNEKAQELVALSSEADAKVQAKLAGRRLEEAEKLAINGKLNAETSTELRASFEEHSRKLKEHQEKLKEDAKNEELMANINADTEVSLGTHQKLLEDIEDSRPEMKDFIGEILDGVHLRLGEAENDRQEIEAKAFVGTGSDVKESTEGVMKAAQNKIDEVKKFVDSKKDVLSAGMKAEFDTQMKVADWSIVEGKVKLEAQAYADAFALFKKAMREAQSAKLFVTHGDGLKIELKNHEATSTTEVEESNVGTDQEREDAQTEIRGKTEVDVNVTGTATGIREDRADGSSGTKFEIEL